MFALALLFATWTDVANALGRAGTEMPGGVYKVSFPRSDLDVVAGGVHVKPALALGSWAAFIRTEHGAMAMGDLVLTENEVSGVIDALQAGGIEQSALHNHLTGESPRVMYLHFDGHGDEVKLAKALHDALARTKTPPPSPRSTATCLTRSRGSSSCISGARTTPPSWRARCAAPSMCFIEFIPRDGATKRDSCSCSADPEPSRGINLKRT